MFSPYTPSANITLYADWTINTYTVSATAGTGGSVNDAGGTYDYHDGPTITATPSTGYTFDEWTGGGSVCTTNPSCDLTLIETNYPSLVATFEPAVYVVTYDANDGTLAGGEDPSYTYGDAAMSAPANPTRVGYDFGGWFLDDGTFLNAAFPLTPTADTSVHAKWTATSGGGGGGGGGGGSSAPTNLSAPFLTGYTSVGSSITASPGTWTNATSFAYQWYRCTAASSITQVEIPANCTFITNAVGSTYVIQAADLGAWIRVRVRARDGVATTSLFSATTAAVGPKPASIKARPPRVSNGLAAVGSTLAAKRGQWNNVGATYTYQWYRCSAAGLKNPRTVPATCVAISGGTAKTYVVRAADKGSYLRVRITATAPTGQGFRMSQTTGIVPN